jgi:hypothetical protein
VSRRLKARTLPDFIETLKQALLAITYQVQVFMLDLLAVGMPSIDSIFALKQPKVWIGLMTTNSKLGTFV